MEILAQYFPLFQEAAVLTVKLGLAGIALALLIGVICAAVQHFHVPVLRRIAAIYIEISRNTPLLVQLFFIYYGLPKIGINKNGEVPVWSRAVLGLPSVVWSVGSFRSLQPYMVFDCNHRTVVRQGIQKSILKSPTGEHDRRDRIR